MHLRSLSARPRLLWRRRSAAWCGAAALLAGASGLALPASAQAAASAAPASQAGQAAAQVCPGVQAPTLRTAVPDTQLDSQFTTYADDVHAYDHWTGADGTYSASLPGHRELWVFSDTFLGYVNPDGTRSPTISDGGSTPFINNSFVEQRAGDTSPFDMTTIHGGTASDPTALMPPPDATHWYWAGDAIMGNGLLQAVYQEYEKFGSGAFDFRWDRNVMAVYAPGHLSSPLHVTSLPSATGVAWGVWLLHSGGYTYIYGVEDLGANKYLHLARVAGNSLTGGPWQYYAGNGSWSASEADAIRLPDSSAPDGFLHVANEFSVSRLGDVYVLVTSNTLTPLSPEIDAYFSCSPLGPFTDRTPLYTTPETGHGGSQHNDPNVYTYNAKAHPEISTGSTLVISYNVNSFVNTDLYSDASIYEPRFIEVTFGS